MIAVGGSKYINISAILIFGDNVMRDTTLIGLDAIICIREIFDDEDIKIATDRIQAVLKEVFGYKEDFSRAILEEISSIVSGRCHHKVMIIAAFK